MTEQRIEENREGTIIRLQGGFYDVMTPEGEVRSRARGNFRKRGISPVVGNFLLFVHEQEEISENAASVQSSEMKSCFISKVRPDTFSK